jgi:nucleoside-diphosphate-sugar epimerase
MSLAAFDHVATPPFVLNVSGPELLSVRRVCEQLAQRMNTSVTFSGFEATDALISNGQLGHRLYGYPRTSVHQMLDYIADWVTRGGTSLGKPTHFETRDGKF